jgi:hypothetical protein
MNVGVGSWKRQVVAPALEVLGGLAERSCAFASRNSEGRNQDAR